ncbi:MAG: chromosomal replication initiator protein DnaA [bacterium]
MSDNKKIWDSALGEIEMDVSRANFSTWFKNTFIAREEDGNIYLSVPNAFVKDWLSNKYHKFILKALRNVSPNTRNVEYIIQKEGTVVKEPYSNLTTEQKTTVSQLKLNEPYVNREDNLNPKYIFENFIVGPFNELAFAASQSVIKRPGVDYNPLYIYGGTGLGKTHLIQAIGNSLKKAGARVFYLTSERYTVELVSAMQNNTINSFKEKYKKYDTLIIDDVQFFGGKDKTQEEIFHLFNDFYNNNKQIVFSSDKPPKFIPNLEERLRSRFEGGMTVDISRPEYESKIAILQTKLKVMNYALSDEALQFIASNVQESIRELEGVLNSVICQSQLKNREINIQEIKALIKNNTRQQKTISFKDILRIIADYYNIEEKFLYEKTRRREVVKPRQIAMYILREDLNSSYPYIGQKFGGRDHTTVIHACEKIKADLKENEALLREIEEIKTLLFGSENKSPILAGSC